MYLCYGKKFLDESICEELDYDKKIVYDKEEVGEPGVNFDF